MAQHQVPIGVTFKVFGEGTWPTQHILEIPVECLPPSMQAAQECLDIYKQEHLRKKVVRVSGLESKVRWMYYFE